MSAPVLDNSPRVPGHALVRISGIQGTCECGTSILLEAAEVRTVVQRHATLMDALIDAHAVHLAVASAWEGR